MVIAFLKTSSVRKLRLIHSVCKKYSIKSLERDSKHYYCIIRGTSGTEKELEASNQQVAELERKVGQLTYEVDWMKKKSEQILGPGWQKRPR